MRSSAGWLRCPRQGIYRVISPRTPGSAGTCSEKVHLSHLIEDVKIKLTARGGGARWSPVFGDIAGPLVRFLDLAVGRMNPVRGPGG